MRERTLMRAITLQQIKGIEMAKPNYTFEKRQKELAKKRKKEEKRQRKAGASNELPANDPPQAPGA